MVSDHYEIKVIDDDIVQVIALAEADLAAIKQELKRDRIDFTSMSGLTYSTDAGPGSLPGIHSEAELEDVEASVIKAIVRRRIVDTISAMGFRQAITVTLRNGKTQSGFVERIADNDDIIFMKNPAVPLASVINVVPN